MALAQQGDEKAYRQLLSEVIPTLQKFATSKLRGLSSEIDDVVQEAVVAIHSARQTYHPSRSFTSWMSAITRHKIIDCYRRNGVRQMVDIENVAESELRSEDSFEVDNSEELLEALKKLPEQHRRAVELTKLEGLSTQEAAQKLGVSPGALRVRIHRAYEMLREDLRKNFSEEKS